MNYWKWAHIVQCFQDLDRKSFSQSHWKALEIIIFNELIQVYAQHLKTYANMASEGELIFDAHNIFAIFMIIISQSF